MSLATPNLMDLDVDDLATLEAVISGAQPSTPPAPAPEVAVATSAPAPAAPAAAAPVPATPPAPAAPVTPEPAPAVPAAPPVAGQEPTAPPVPPAEPAPVSAAAPADPMAEVKPRYYTRSWSPLNKLAAHIMAGNPDMTPSQAEAKARVDLGMEPLQMGSGSAPAATAPGALTPASPTPAPAVRTAATVQAEMEQIQSQYLQAVENDGGLTTPETAKLQLQYSQRAAELLQLQTQEATALASEDAQFETQRANSLAAAYAMHPDSQNPDTAVGKAVASVLAKLEANNDPRLEDVRAPELVMQLALLEAKTAPVAQAPAPVSPAQPQAAPTAATVPATPDPARAAVPPVLPGSGTSAAPATGTVQDLNATLNDMFTSEDGGDPFGAVLYPHLSNGAPPPPRILL